MAKEQVQGVAVFDDYRHNLRIAVVVRWFLLIAWLAQHNYRPGLEDPTYIQNNVLAISLAVLNGYVTWRIWKGLPVPWPWAAGLSVMDLTTITLGIARSKPFDNNFFVLYYPALAALAVVFTSRRVSVGAATAVAAVYVCLSLFLEPRVDFALKEEKVLYIRVVTMYILVVAVNVMTRVERIRRREAVEAAQEAERALHTERIRISEEIHNGAAQSVYVISLGLEACNKLARNAAPELNEKITAIHGVAKQALWELRYPINLGLVFEGKDLARVLETHVHNFKTITSIPTTLSISGVERPLPTMVAQRLFWVAHNAMTNVYRHASASSVEISLAIESSTIGLAIADDGIGLPTVGLDSFTGHGLRSIRRAAEELGGKAEISSAPGKGTSVMVSVPLRAASGGAT